MRRSGRILTAQWLQPESTSNIGYNLEGEAVLPLLPHKVAEEDDGEVVVTADQAAEKAHKLSKSTRTKMARHTISILWLRSGLACPCENRLLLYDDWYIFKFNSL